MVSFQRVEVLRPEPIPEQEEIPGKVLDFFELTAEQESKLKKEIKKHNGLVRIFVHPEWQSYIQFEDRMHAEGKTKKSSADRIKKIEQAMKKILLSDSEDLPPIILLKEITGAPNILELPPYTELVNRLEEKSDYLTEFAEQHPSKQKIYIVPTKSFSPDPILTCAQDEDEAWGYLVVLMKELGVKKILAGGGELYLPLVNQESSDSDEQAEGTREEIWKNSAGCLGKTMRKFADDFQVDLSALAYPGQRRDVVKIQKEVKAKTANPNPPSTK